MGSHVSYETFPSKPKIIFMGTPAFAVPTLKALIHEKYEILSIVTQPDRPRGRGQKLKPSPIKLCAEENNLPLLQPQRLDDNFLHHLVSLTPDLLIVVAFGQIIPKKVLNSAKWGGINIHASLLPQYRGSAPIQWAVMNNEKKTGLTIMVMDEGLDTGPILMQQEVDILVGETAGMLHDRLSSLAPSLLMKTLDGLANGAITERKQDDSLATFAPKLKKEQGLINWFWPAKRLYGLIRGLDPWPGAFTYYNERMLKLYDCSLTHKGKTFAAPGRIRALTERGLEIETGKGSIIVGEIQAPGKKRMSGKEFQRGSTLRVGNVLGK